MHERQLRLLLVLLAACAVAACAGAPPSRGQDCIDPDARVMQLRQSWQETPGTGTYGCTSASDSGASKELVRRQAENLAFRNPRHVPTLMFSALTAYEANDPQRAIEHLDDILALQPDHADAAQLRIRIALEQGNTLLARRLLRDHLALHPDHAGLYESLAALRYTDGDHDGALQALDAAGRLGAPPYRVAFNRGLVEEGRGNVEAAKAHYRTSLAALPNWLPAKSRLRGLEKGLATPMEPLTTASLPR